MSQQDDFIKEFLVESREGLTQLDNDLVALEQNPTDTDRIDSAFRVLHTIKGNAGFLDFTRLGELAHAGEALLQRLRGGDIPVTGKIIDALLDVIDAIRQMMMTIEETGLEGDQRFEGVESRLNNLAKSAKSELAPKQKSELPSTFRKGSQEQTSPPSKAQGDEQHNAEGKPKPDEPDIAHKPAKGNSVADFPTTVAYGDDKAKELSTSNQPPKEIFADPPPPSDPPKPEPTPEDLAAQALTTATPPANVTADQIRDRSAGGSSTIDRVNKGITREPTEQSVKSPSSLVRVDVDLLDGLMNLVGELVLTRNQILELSHKKTDSALSNSIQQLDALTTELQEGVLKTRMQPIGSIWHRYPRMVRDISRMSGKDVSLSLSGQETELDKSLVEAISDPLIHLIRNAVDHGIEKPYLRKIKGKPEAGQIRLSATHESGQVHIEIADDGAGLDLAKIRDRAIKRGLITTDEAELMQASELAESIFSPGFSTADQVSNISGRGVGMDVVKTHVERVGGTIEIDSEVDIGTTFRLTVPLTLAIIPALIVTANGQRFAIPQTNVVELLSVRSDSGLLIDDFHDAPVLRLRGEILPIVSLNEQLGFAEASLLRDSLTDVIVLKTGTQQFGISVDSIGNTEEIVVKPFGQILEGMPEYGGATIMGDGSVALILDVRGIAQRAGLFATDRSLLHDVEIVDEEVSTATEEALLVAEIADRQRIAFPLRGVVRIEEIEEASVERSAGQYVLQYRGDILPVVRISEQMQCSKDAGACDDMNVVIYNSQGRQVGLEVRRVVDIVDHPEPIRPAREPGIRRGTTVALV